MYQTLDQNSESSDGLINSKIEKLQMPCLWKVPEQFKIGTFVKISGKTEENAVRFAINLMADDDDIALHFNPRLKDGFVVRNARINNEWCNEEREPMYMPFEKNKSFDLIISVEEEVYRIFVNGIHFIDFSHRLSYSSVTCIAIDGQMHVYGIQFDRIDCEHDLDPNACFISSSIVPKETPPVVQNIFDPKLPFIHEIPNGIRVGMVLAIIGRPLSNAHKFDINLVQKKNFGNNSDIAFHMSVRFGKHINESKVVRNYRFGGEWGPEDKYCTEFPFTAEKIFDLRIIVEKSRYIIIINGKNFTEFPNRLYPLSNTNQIEIYGNLDLLSVSF